MVKIDVEQVNGEEKQTWSVTKHTFNDLSRVPPLVFVYLLKRYYVNGTIKATAKFRVVQEVVTQVLRNGPQPGAAVFVAQCFCVLPIFGSYCDGFSHLIYSSFKHFLNPESSEAEVLDAKPWAAKLFVDVVGHELSYDEKLLLKIIDVFHVNLLSIGRTLCGSEGNDAFAYLLAKTFVQQYILKLIDCNSFRTAVSLLEHFSLREFDESFLLRLIDNNEIKASEKWASSMGRKYLCTLVQELIDRKLIHVAHEISKKNNLKKEFPDLQLQWKKSKLKKLAEKGRWDVAETSAKDDTVFLEYLVYLAMEAGYFEKVKELCDRHSLEGFANIKELESKAAQSNYLQLKELSIDEVVWVDDANGLRAATCHLEGCKVVGVDSEWKPNSGKESLPIKVSIMQIASEKKVYILDLIKLHNDIPDVLDECLVRILHAPGILKLGYNIHCDVSQLSHSYESLECFKYFDMVLDLQKVFKKKDGGLSGLSKEILGSGLNKTRRCSNWELRPLSEFQLEYAALDAAVLLHIFSHVRGHTVPEGAFNGTEKFEWKSHIITRLTAKKFKRATKKQTNE